jgi:hypothetical protein
VQEGKISLRWLATAEMPADGLTKALTAQKHATFVRQLNLVDISTKISANGHAADTANAHEEEEETALEKPRYATLGVF